ncbi:Exosome complex exonuclease RRP42 [Glycine soja]
MTFCCVVTRRQVGKITLLEYMVPNGGKHTTKVYIRMVGLSLGEKHFIQGGIGQDLRCDGRKRFTYKPISVETEVIPQTNGSARVRMGATDVIASAKGRGGDELAAELSNALQRCLLGGKSGAGARIGLSSLIVVEGKICWDLYIDGLLAALSNTGIPRVQVAAGTSNDEQPEVDVSNEEFLQFDTSGVPVIVTLTKVGTWEALYCGCNIRGGITNKLCCFSVNRQGHICGITKRGGVGLDPSTILQLFCNSAKLW